MTFIFTARNFLLLSCYFHCPSNVWSGLRPVVPLLHCGQMEVLTFCNFSIFLYSTLKFNPVHIPGFHGGMLGGPAAHLIYHIFLPFTGPVSSLIGYAGWDPSAWVGGQKGGRYLLRGEALSCVALSWFELLQGLPSCRAPSAGRGMACSASS